MNLVTLTFTKEQLAVLNQALVQLPFCVVAPLIQHINVEIQKQFETNVNNNNPTEQTTFPD